MLTEEMLQNAALEADAILRDRIPDYRKETHEFSRRFKRRMHHLIRRVDHPVRYWFGRVAAILAALILAGGVGVLVVDENVRAIVPGWMRMQTGRERFEYSFYGEDGDDALQKEPRDLPEGYEQWESGSSEIGYWISYLNSEGGYIDFDVMYHSESVSLEILGDHVLVKTIYEEGQVYDLYLSKDLTENSTVVWQDEEGVLYEISGMLSEGELIQMAKSVK